MLGKIYDVLGGIFGIVCLAAIIVLVYSCSHDKSIEKKYGEIRYEFVITDKYEELGSTWHLVGGRATEQEYHIVYRYRLTNRPDDETNMKWYKGNDRVSCARYRELQVGQTLYNNTLLFPYY